MPDIDQPDVPPVLPDAVPDTNPFTSIAATMPKVPPPADNPFDAVVGSMDDANAQASTALKQAYYGVKDTNVARSAKVMQVAKQTNLPPDVVDSSLEALEGLEQFKAAPLARIAEQNPALAAHLTKPGVMGVMKDDVHGLTGIDNLVASIQAHAYGLAWDPSGTLAPGFTYVRNGGGIIQEMSPDGHTAEHFTRDEYMQTLKDRGFAQFADDIDRQTQALKFQSELGPFMNAGAGAAQVAARWNRWFGNGQSQQSADELGSISQEQSPGMWGDVQRAAGGMAADAPLLLAGGGLAEAADGLLHASKLSSLIDASMSAKAASWVSKGATVATAMAPVNLASAADVGHEHGALAGIADFLASSAIMGATPSGVAGVLVKDAVKPVANGFGALAAHMLKDAGLQYTQGAALALSQRLQDRFLGSGEPINADELVHSMTRNGAVNAALSLPFAAMSGMQARQHVLDTYRAAEGIDFGTKVRDLVMRYQAMKSTEVAPDVAKGTVEAAQSGQPTHVYTPSEDWRTHWLAEGQDPAAKAEQYGIGSQYRESLATGADMAVPLHEFVAASAESKDPQKLIGKSKSAPGNATAEEGAQYYRQTPEELAAQAKGLFEDAAKAGMTENAERDAIHDKYTQQILESRPDLGKDKAEALANVYANHFANLAARLNEGVAETGGQRVSATDLADVAIKKATHGPSTDALDTAVQAIVSGADLHSPEMQSALGDLRAHAESVRGELNAHTVQGMAGELRKSMADKYGFKQGAVAPKGKSLAFEDLVKQWKKAHGDRTPTEGSPEWEALVEKAAKVDASLGRSYNQPNKEAPARGFISFNEEGKATVHIGASSDASTFLHELMHHALDQIGDLSQAENAPQSLKGDYQKLLDYSGFGTHEAKAASQRELGQLQSHIETEGREATEAERKRIDELSAPHEKVAQAFEKYFLEGVAPTAELRPLFARIKNWMLDVYGRVKGLGVELTPEIRGVFDRMVASRDAIEEARLKMGDEPIFKSAAEAGWTQEQYEAYNKTVQEEKDSEETRLQQQVMAEYAQQKSDHYKAKLQETREEVEANLNEKPIWKAMHILQHGKLPDGTEIAGGKIKLDRAEIVREYGDEGVKRLPGKTGYSLNGNKGQSVTTKDGGIGLEAAANIFGFPSGDELYQALISAPDKKELIESQAQALMSQKYPTLQDVIAEKAVDSLHSDRKSRLIMRTLDSLGHKTGQRPAPVELLRAVARDTILNRAAKDVRPAVYRSAEAKAGREVLAAMAKQDYNAAFAAQQRRLLSAELYRAATDARKRIDKNQEWQKRFDSPDKRKQLIKASSDDWVIRTATETLHASSEDEAKRISGVMGNAPWEHVSDYMDAIDSLRNRYGLSPRTSPATVRDFVNGKIREVTDAGLSKYKDAEAAGMTPEDFAEDQKRSAGITMSDAIIDGEAPTKENPPSVGELDELHGAMRNIEKLAMKRNAALTEGSKETFKDQRDALIAQAEDSKRRIRRVSSTPGVLDKVSGALNSLDAWHTALSTFAHELDGYKDGGVWFDALVRPLNDAATREHQILSGDAAAMHELVKAWGKDDGLGSVYRPKYIEAVKDNLSYMGRIMVALNWGAKHNRERLMTGHGWSEEQVGAILDSLDKKDMDFVQGIWDHIATKFPEIKAQDQRLFGSDLEQREVVPVQTKHGTYRGGYLPIKYDPRASVRGAMLDEATAISDKRRGAFGAAKTGGSFTKQVMETTGRRLLLNESVVYRHLDEVAHRLSHEDALAGIRRILMSKDIQNVVSATHGMETFGKIRDAVTDVAKGTEQLGGIWKMVNHLRTGVASAAFGFNFFRGFLDLATSLPQATVRIGIPDILTGLRKWGTNAITMEGSAKSIAAESPMMAERMRDRLRKAEDAMKGARFGGTIRENMSHYAQAAMHKFHLMTDNIAYLAAKERAAREFPDDPAKALAVAEALTKDVSGSADLVDLAKVQRGNELMKMLTVAYGFFSKTYQAQRVAMGRAGIENALNPADYARSLANTPGKMGRLFVDYAMIYTMPIAIDMWLKSALRGSQQDNEKELAAEFFKEHLAFGLSTMVGFRELGGALTGPFGYGGPAGERGVQVLYSLIQNAAELKGGSGAQRSALQLAGILFHLPSAQIQRVMDGYAYAAEHNLNPIVPMITGAPSKH